MKSEKSCGAIVLSSNNGNRNVLLIKHENGSPAVHLSATRIGWRLKSDQVVIAEK